MATFLARIDLAPAIDTAAAGAIEKIFGTTGLGAFVAILGQGAITAVTAGKENEFGEMFKPEQGAAQHCFVNGQAAVLGRIVEQAVRFEGQIVNEVAEMVKQGLSPGRCQGRSFLVVEAGILIPAEIIEAVGRVRLKFMNEIGPLPLSCRGLAEDKVEVCHVESRAADVHAAIVHATQDSKLAGRPFQVSFFALVCQSGLLFHTFEEVVGNHTAGNTPLVHEAGHMDVGDEEIAKQGNAEIVLINIAEGLVILAGVKAELGDAVIGPGADFALQLVILHHQLSFRVFEGRDGDADKKGGGVQAGSGFPLVEMAEEIDDMDGVEVENRFRVAAKPLLGIVAGNDQQVVETNAVPAIQKAFHLVTVFILAGKVADDIQTHFKNFLADDIRRQGGVAAGIISDGDGGDATVSRHASGQVKGLGVEGGAAAAAWHKLKGEGEFSRVSEGRLEAAMFLRR